MGTILIVLIAFLACSIGAICGIGGGVIVKPALDAFGVVADPKQAGFLSCCMVLAMSSYSIIKNLSSSTDENKLDVKTGIVLAVPAAIGGVLGKQLFSQVQGMFSDKAMVAGVQATVLLLLTLLTMIYTINKSKIKGLDITGYLATGIVGFLLGTVSSFLGIGGGPINLMVLFFFFSMASKKASIYSLFIIFFSQLANLATTLFTTGVPNVPVWLAVVMAVTGLVGGIIGRKINKKIEEHVVDKLFIGLMVVIMAINAFNIYKFFFM